MRRVMPFAFFLIPLVGLLAFIGIQVNTQVHPAHSQSRTANTTLAANAYIYYVLKDTRGFVLARARKGSNNEPVETPQSIALFGNDFGLSDSDSVSSLQLSPDAAYLAIDGVTDHGEYVWIYNTQHGGMALQPARVMGNFLHWLPQGHSFLYRAMFPLGPGAPMDGNQWNPGLWVVDAATGAYKNIDIHTSSANLIDAAPSPDGSHILYSITMGLGRGSSAWLSNSDGSQQVHVLDTVGGAQSILGLFAWSPDGTHIAYERLSDSATPFLPAGLWLMDSQGGQQRRLADTDGGHGFAPIWSPDGRKIAFVIRTNTNDRRADLLAQSLQCGIGVVDIQGGRSWLAVSPQQTGMQMNVHPVWSTNSNSITFTAMNPINRVLGSTPRYWSASIAGVQAQAATPAQTALTPLTPSLTHVVAVS